jgi:hypothetical protein
MIVYRSRFISRKDEGSVYKIQYSISGMLSKILQIGAAFLLDWLDEIAGIIRAKRLTNGQREKLKKNRGFNRLKSLQIAFPMKGLGAGAKIDFCPLNDVFIGLND